MSSNNTVQFSPREMEVLALAWQCMEAQPKIDMNKLALLTGYTPGSASVTFGNIKRKIKLLGEGLAADGPATPKKGSTAGRAKPANTSRSSGKHARKDVDEEPTPSKKSKKSGGRKVKHDEDDEDDEDDEHSMPRIKREELADVTNGANDFIDQLQVAAGQYEFEQYVGLDD